MFELMVGLLIMIIVLSIPVIGEAIHKIFKFDEPKQKYFNYKV